MAVAELNVEIIECADGVLEMLREGNKLVGVSFVHRTPRTARGFAATLPQAIEDEVDLDQCHYCRTWVEYRNGSWYDFADRFLCRESPTSMHKVIDVDDLASPGYSF